MSGDETPAEDPLALIDSIESVREALRGVVAAFVADGFTDVQARELTVAMWVQSTRAVS